MTTLDPFSFKFYLEETSLLHCEHQESSICKLDTNIYLNESIKEDIADFTLKEDDFKVSLIENLIVSEQPSFQITESNLNTEIVVNVRTKSPNTSKKRMWARASKTDFPKSNSKDKNGPSKFYGQQLEDNTISSKLEDLYAKLTERQIAIEQGVYKYKGPGRKRTNPYLTGKGIKDVLLKYLRLYTKKVLENHRCSKRKDALLTIWFRKVKKAAYQIVNCWTIRNLYKHGEVEYYMTSFLEANFAFRWAVNKIGDSIDFERFCEFIITYFPEVKAAHLLNCLRIEGKIGVNFWQTQLKYLAMRDVTTKTNIFSWAKNSETIREILRLAVEVLCESEFSQDDLADHLKKNITLFLAEL